MKVRQITAIRKDGFKYIVRYDVEKHLLYQQNRSRDVEMSLECFIDMLKTTKRKARELGHKLIDEHIEKESLWI